MSDPKKRRPLWFGLGLDPIAQSITVLAVAQSRTECERSVADRRSGPDVSPDITYTLVFDFLSEGAGRQLREWLQQCGVPSTELPGIAEQFTNSIRRIIKK
jgi:hypothetical protein